MEDANRSSRLRCAARPACVLALAPLLGLTLSGCLVVGYSSRGGFFIWPGSLVLLLILALLYFLLRGR